MGKLADEAAAKPQRQRGPEQQQTPRIDLMLDGPVKSGNREDEAVGGSAGRDLLCNTEPYKWVRENTFIWRLPASLDIGSCSVVVSLS